MNRIRIIKYYSAISVLVPMLFLFIWHSDWWPVVLFVGWGVAAAAIWIIGERKEQEHRNRTMMHAMQTTMIRTLNHHRHDWMNDLQVLYGYIRMGKTEKMIQCVEQIRDNMQHESKIAKLGIPSLTVFLQSFRTLTNKMQLQIRIREERLDLSQLPMDGEKLAAGLIEIMNAYRFGVKASMGEVPSLVLEFARVENRLQIVLSFDGELMDEDEWKQKWQQRIKGTPLQPQGEIAPERLTFQIALAM